MTTLSEGKSLGDLVRYEAENRYSREEMTLASGAGDLKIGTVLGKITVGGKYIISRPAASDGSQTPVAVLLVNANATSADVKATSYVREAKLNRHALIFDATINDATKRATAVAALRAVGIVAD